MSTVRSLAHAYPVINPNKLDLDGTEASLNLINRLDIDFKLQAEPKNNLAR